MESTLNYNSKGRQKTSGERWFERIMSVVSWFVGVAIIVIGIAGTFYLFLHDHPWLALFAALLTMSVRVRITFEDD